MALHGTAAYLADVHPRSQQRPTPGAGTIQRSTLIPEKDKTIGFIEAVEPAQIQPTSIRIGSKLVRVGPLPIGLDAASLEFVREVQAITCATRSFISLQDCLIYTYFEEMEDAITFLETWIFLVDQSESETADATNAPAQLQLATGLSQRTLLSLKQYLATFGRGGYLVIDEGNGLSFLFNDPADAELMRQQFGRAFQSSESA